MRNLVLIICVFIFAQSKSMSIAVGTKCGVSLFEGDNTTTLDTIKKSPYIPKIKDGDFIISPFYPYEEDGLWGVKRREEIVMTPGFEELKGENSIGVFIYKENGKYGIVSLWDIMTPPIYDEAEIIEWSFGRWGAKVKINGKYGVVSLSGDTIISPIYEYLSDIKRINYEHYFIVKETNSEYKFINTDGECISKGIVFPKDEFPTETQKIRKQLRDNLKQIQKQRQKRAKKDAAYIALNRRISNTIDLCKDAANLGKLNPDIPTNPISIAGFDGVINELGVIDITLKYSSAEDILKRDPSNIYAISETMKPPYNPSIGTGFSATHDLTNYYEYCRQVWENAKFKVEKLKCLLQICDMKGYNGSVLENSLKEDLEKAVVAEQKAREEVNSNEKNIAFNNKVDKIAGALTGALNATATAISGTSITNDVTTSDGISSNIYGGSNENTLSEATLRSQYEKWESLAKKHYNSLTNTGYKVKKGGTDVGGGNGQSLNGGNYVLQKKALREAQSQMRRIRQKAKNAGYSITKSEYETVTVEY